MKKRFALRNFWLVWMWLRREGWVMLRAMMDRRTPWQAKAVMAGMVLYIFSPIDIIPDFIPFLGVLDDLAVIPFALSWARRLIPDDVWATYESKVARVEPAGMPRFGSRGIKDVTPRR